MSALLNLIYYRARYRWRRAVRFFGTCPDCWSTLNYSRGTQRPHCPHCGRFV